MVNIAVLASGGGTNLQAIIDAQKNGIINYGEIKLIVCDRVCYSQERANIEGIPCILIERKKYKKETFEKKLLESLKEYDIELIVLAGFLTILTSNITSLYENRIMNIHPSLLPRFGGKGYYGIIVHEKVLEAKEKISGATVHFVNEIPDGGRIILQESLEVLETDTPETLQRRIMEQIEWKIFPKAIEMISREISSES